MIKKICSKCKIEKDITSFQKNSRSKTGVRSECSECSKLMKRNSSHLKEYYKKYRETHRVELNEKQKKYYNENKTKIKENKKEYRKNNKEKLNIKSNLYYKLNCEKINKEKREKYNVMSETDKNKIRTRSRNYYNINNKKRTYTVEQKNKLKNFILNKRKNNGMFKLTFNVRNRINAYLKSNKIKKNNKTFDIVGCTPQKLKEYIESKFIDGMSWDNYGIHGWHIDHIIPLSSAKTEDELYKLCNFTNLQPLWATDNLKKSNKLI